MVIKQTNRKIPRGKLNLSQESDTKHETDIEDSIANIVRRINRIGINHDVIAYKNLLNWKKK